MEEGIAKPIINGVAVAKTLVGVMQSSYANYGDFIATFRKITPNSTYVRTHSRI